MLLCGINDNILISRPSYLGLYQYEAFKKDFYKEINIFGVGTKPKKNDKTMVHVSLSKLVFFNIIPLYFWKGASCSGLNVFENSKY